MRWVRRLAVLALLVAPIAVVVAVARPDDDVAAAGDPRGGGSGPDGALEVGDQVTGELGFGETAIYRVVGEGEVRIGATGNDEADLTLVVREAGGGDRIAENDDTNGRDPEVRIELDGGERVDVEIRELNANPAQFTVYVL